jgi:hypothetical protein
MLAKLFEKATLFLKKLIVPFFKKYNLLIYNKLQESAFKYYSNFKLII